MPEKKTKPKPQRNTGVNRTRNSGKEEATEGEKDPVIEAMGGAGEWNGGAEFLCQLAAVYASKAGSFVTVYFTMLFGLYALMAISMQLQAIVSGVCPLYPVLYFLLAVFLLLGAAISAIQYYGSAAVSTKAIQELQVFVWGAKPRNEAVTTRLVERAGFPARASNWLHDYGPWWSWFVLGMSYGLTVVLVLVIGIFLCGYGSCFCAVSAFLWPVASLWLLWGLSLVLAALIAATAIRWHRLSRA